MRIGLVIGYLVSLTLAVTGLWAGFTAMVENQLFQYNAAMALAIAGVAGLWCCDRLRDGKSLRPPFRILIVLEDDEPLY